MINYSDKQCARSPVKHKEFTFEDKQIPHTSRTVHSPRVHQQPVTLSDPRSASCHKQDSSKPTLTTNHHRVPFSAAQILRPGIRAGEKSVESIRHQPLAHKSLLEKSKNSETARTSSERHHTSASESVQAKSKTSEQAGTSSYDSRRRHLVSACESLLEKGKTLDNPSSSVNSKLWTAQSRVPHEEPSIGHKSRPSLLRLSPGPSNPSDDSDTSPTHKNAPLGLSPSRQSDSEAKLPKRGVKRSRIAHKSDGEIKRQRLEMECKLSTPVTPTSPTSTSRRPRIGSASSGNKGLRATLRKQMNKPEKHTNIN